MNLQQFVEFAIGSFASLFPIVDPLGSVPIFLVLTAKDPPRLRQQTADRIAVYTVLVLALFLLVGSGILRFFGISLEVIRIAGGMVVVHSAWQMMGARSRLSKRENEKAIHRHQNEQYEDIAFTPMTMPMLAGPGAIATILGLAAQAGRTLTLTTLLNLLATLLAIALLGVAICLCLRASCWLLNFFGETGIMASSRILGFITMAVGVQFILNGLADWLKDLQ
ncbi:MAG: MarC family NAAT transporter [Hydrococcus sp. C42_A2020_068]|uniref:MarC family NAAT transporter n=1 Tax=Pleurocapsa sp. PCC 7327 TaxID=118163 RepID=UPI00029FA3C6|nr:MarC family NAAT transporter [Pleurocapsa sp. PCC 7327]AFY75857.1 membrane protein, MarC family [Pleurocapsa sp. PCC 7327]MBF2020367.1 MarC family NAAT transporter [Hydrococcus sp. C42_A2020_068]